MFACLFSYTPRENSRVFIHERAGRACRTLSMNQTIYIHDVKSYQTSHLDNHLITA